MRRPSPALVLLCCGALGVAAGCQVLLWRRGSESRALGFIGCRNGQIHVSDVALLGPFTQGLTVNSGDCVDDDMATRAENARRRVIITLGGEAGITIIGDLAMLTGKPQSDGPKP